MNTTTMKTEIANLLTALQHSGCEGWRIASLFKTYRNRLERDAQQKFGLSEERIEMAFGNLLGICLAEVIAGIDAEMNDYESFWSDMRAHCTATITPDDAEEICVTVANAILDEALSSKEKQNLYRMCARAIIGKCLKKGIKMWDIEDMASDMYNRLLSQRVGKVFLHGMPTNEAEWMAFLRKDAEFAWMNYYKKMWRHPTFSLDEAIAGNGHEDDGEELRRVDMLCCERDAPWQPNRKDDFLASLESQHELQYVPEVFGRISARCTPQTRKALKRLLLDEADIETVSAESGMTPNALYVAKKRFLDALGHKGPIVLSEIEMSAA